MSVCSTLEIDGLGRIDLYELEKAVGKENITVVETSGDAKYGELTVLTAIVLLVPSVLSLIAIWLSRNLSKRTLTLNINKRKANGEYEKVSLTLNENQYQDASKLQNMLSTFLDASGGNSV